MPCTKSSLFEYGMLILSSNTRTNIQLLGGKWEKNIYVCVCVCVRAEACAKLLQSWPTLWPHGLQPSRLSGIFQARILEWVSISYSNIYIILANKSKSYQLSTNFTAATAKSLQSCPTLCDPINSSPPGSSVHRILQARILERVAISSFTKEEYICVILWGVLYSLG